MDIEAAPAGTYRIDAVHTFSEFSVRHLIVGRVDGRFNAIEGTFVVGTDFERLFDRLDVRIDAASIDTALEMRDEDLRGGRFFDVSVFPALAFSGTTTARTGAATWTVTGELTIRDVTRSVAFDILLRGTTVDQRGRPKLAARATAALTRLDYGLTTELVEESGDEGGPDVDVRVDVEAFLESS